MENVRLPQLRVLVTDHCDSKCVYCRPGGEGNLNCHHLAMSYKTAREVAIAYRKLGGNSIKISGGDPVFWNHLTEYVDYLKNQLHYNHVELITRSVKIYNMIDELKFAGLDVMNFSFDTLDEKRYKSITGKTDFNQFKKVICECSEKLYSKINTVVLPDTTDDDLQCMINFCLENGVRELKLLDYIDDLNGERQVQIEQEQLFKRLYRKMDDLAHECNIEFQGGLGHPMRSYKISDRLKVICKDASQGAWYCSLCLNCSHYPCHDALMALRVTPSDSFQLCLLNRNMHWKFDMFNLDKQLHSIMKHYQGAFFEGGTYENNSTYTS